MRITVVVAVAILSVAAGQEYGGGHALFVRTSSTDARQQSDPPGYLPPYSTQRPPERPRPFQAPSTGQQPSYASPSQNEATNYSYQRSPSTVFSPPYSTPSSQSPYGASTSYNPRPTTSPSYSNSGSSAFPPFSSTRSSSTYLPPSSGYPSSSPAAPGYSTSSAVSSNYGGYSTPGGFSSTYGYSTQRPSPSYVPSGSGSSANGFSSAGGFTTYGYPTENPKPPFPTPGPAKPYEENAGYPAQETSDGQSGTEIFNQSTNSESTGEDSNTIATGAADDESKHPPHIHALDVECSKTMMTINIEFNRAFDGVIYSKGYFASPECRYVAQNSGQTKYAFTVSLDSCGTQFINDFAGEAGQAYLENVLVLQNEPGIQEVWDTVRRVRCLWEGNINKALTVNFSVDMLKQEIVTFSGDTAIAKLDIQVGRGPFAPAADGLVKIGETMTLVVTVEGDPAFDLQVRDCLARDESSTNTVQLTDERGCILKPKFFGAFQKTNDTGNTGASIIAYAYFQAFKFPDVMDLFIECNVELCKTDCEPCPQSNQQIEPGRRRRSIPYAPLKVASNASTELLSDPVRVGRGFKVIMVEDLSKASNQILEHLEETVAEEIRSTTANVCITHSGLYAAVAFMLTTIVATTITAAVFYVKLQRVYRSKSVNS